MQKSESKHPVVIRFNKLHVDIDEAAAILKLSTRAARRRLEDLKFINGPRGAHSPGKRKWLRADVVKLAAEPRENKPRPQPAKYGRRY